MRNQLWILLVIMFFISTTMVGTPVYASSGPAVVSAPIIVDRSKRPGSTFSINITIANVTEMWGYEFILSYDTRVLTATGYSSYEPFSFAWPSEINDTAGYVAVAYSMMMSESVGFSTVDPTPIVRIDFEVDRRGSTMLDLHDTMLTDIYGEMIPHDVVDGFFANIHVEAPDIAATSVTLPEPSNATSSGIYSVPCPGLLATESRGPRWYAGAWLKEGYSAKAMSGSVHTYENYVSDFPVTPDRFVTFHIVIRRENATHYEMLEVGFVQNLTGFYLYAAWRINGNYEDVEPYTASPLTDYSLEIVETTPETFEARIDSVVLKTVTFTIHGDREYSAFAESVNQGINSLRGHFWDLKYYDSDGVPHVWQQVEPYADEPYTVSPAPDDFYTRGGGVLGDINGDGYVDISDAGKINAYFHSPPFPDGPLGYDENADIYPDSAPDGRVNILDASLVNAHWHEEAPW